MPGLFARDINAPALHTGVTLNAAGTTNGTPQRVDKPGAVEVEVATGAVTSTGNSATLLVRLQGSDDAAASVNVVELGEFTVKSGADAALSNKVYRMQGVFVDKAFVRAIVTLGGTAPNFTGTTITLQPRWSRAKKSDSA
jgi:hypothetical protein